MCISVSILNITSALCLSSSSLSPPLPWPGFYLLNSNTIALSRTPEAEVKEKPKMFY